MTPIIAFILCTAFVLWLLLLERKQSPNVSPIFVLPINSISSQRILPE